MTPPVVQAILRAVAQVEHSYERLVLVVGPSGAGKTAALRAVGSHLQCPPVNVNLGLSQLLLDVPRSSWSLQAPDLLDALLADHEDDSPILLDNLELLFDTALQVQPLNWLRRVSRSRTVVATWSGTVDHGFITYAEPGHPEYRREPVGDLVTVLVSPHA